MLRPAILIVAAALAGCAVKVPMASPSDDQAGKEFAPPAEGLAALYVFREGGFGAPYPLNISVGQRTLGALGPDTWFLINLPPGTYDVRCLSQNTVVNIAAGETRFIEAALRVGPSCAPFEVSPAAARKAISNGSRAAEVR